MEKIPKNQLKGFKIMSLPKVTWGKLSPCLHLTLLPKTRKERKAMLDPKSQ